MAGTRPRCLELDHKYPQGGPNEEQGDDHNDRYQDGVGGGDLRWALRRVPVAGPVPTAPSRSWTAVTDAAGTAARAEGVPRNWG